MKTRYALISVSDKTGIIAVAQALISADIHLLATGNTARHLTENGIPLTQVSDYTGFPEIMDGRVKTLHPKIHAGILARRDTDATTLNTLDIDAIDFVIVNLYPFEKTRSIEQIDIGGPTLLRAAAKNYQWVSAITDPSDYPQVIRALQDQGSTTLDFRKQLAAKVFSLTSDYDRMISTVLTTETATQSNFPETLSISLEKKHDLRYGENPQQDAASYGTIPPSPASLLDATLLQGKPLSYNNLLDSDAALQTVSAFSENTPACAIIKHATPCGVALGQTLEKAYTKALSCDPQSAFGGIIAVNCVLDADTAHQIHDKQFAEVVLAPEIADDALSVLSQKKNLRVLRLGTLPPPSHSTLEYRSVSGGLVVQTPDTASIPSMQALQSCTQPTDRKPSNNELHDLLFAWQVVRTVKSNAIVYAKELMTCGIGSGQTSRVFSAQIAGLKAAQANLTLQGAVMASDAFFPFPDSLDIASELGITAVIQPGGSRRDAEVIAHANKLGLAMVLTGQRHFKH